MKLRKINKKGQIATLPFSIITLGIAVIILVLMLVIIQEMRDVDVVTAGGLENSTYQAANDTLVGLGTLGDFWVIIVLAVVAAVVIGVIFSLFAGTRGRR